MRFSPDGRRLLRGSVEDPSAWVDAIAESNALLYNQDGSAVLLDGGRLVLLGRDILTKIIEEHVAVEQVKNIGSAAAPFFKQEFTTVLPGEMLLRGLLTADTLVQRLPKIAGEPRTLTKHLREEISQRLRDGEPAARIADAHRIDIETVRGLAR
jgi:hypothetical protein